MTTIEQYKEEIRASLTKNRRKLLVSLEWLIRDAKMLKRQAENGRVHDARLCNSGRHVDRLAGKMIADKETLAKLETIP